VHEGNALFGAVQAAPHPPQFASDVVRSTHSFPHCVSGGVHGGVGAVLRAEASQPLEGLPSTSNQPGSQDPIAQLPSGAQVGAAWDKVQALHDAHPVNGSFVGRQAGDPGP
jgi:hypothetical protein